MVVHTTLYRNKRKHGGIFSSAGYLLHYEKKKQIMFRKHIHFWLQDWTDGQSYTGVFTINPCDYTSPVCAHHAARAVIYTSLSGPEFQTDGWSWWDLDKFSYNILRTCRISCCQVGNGNFGRESKCHIVISNYLCFAPSILSEVCTQGDITWVSNP